MKKYFAVLVASLLFITHVQAATVNLGILSDSGSDEYRADDNRGGAYASTTFIWDELLVRYRGVNIGSWGSRAEPRRTGYEYNWARSGATAAPASGTGNFIAFGAHTGLATQIQQGLVNIVYLSIGTNDFAYYGDGASIYNGSISGQTLQNKINQIVSNITLAVTTVRNANPTIPIILVTAGDMGNFPTWRAQYPDATKRLKVTNAIESANQGIRSIATTHQHIVLIEGIDLMSDVLGNINASGNLIVGDQTITLTSNGDEPHHIILGDNIHAGTVVNGIIANRIIGLINQGLGTQLSPFSTAELLTNAGIQTSIPTPTVPAQKIGDANGDNSVNGADFVIWLNHYGQNVSGTAVGDFNNSGKVDGADFVVWLNNYGK